MKMVKNKGINKPVILTKILDDKILVVVDNETTIRYFDKNDLHILDGFKVNIIHERYTSRVVDFSHDGQYFATLTNKNREARLYNANTKKLISKVDRHHGEVSCVGIDPLNRYMFSCGDDGKTFAIDTKSGKLVFTLPMHIDTVNDIIFSKNGNWVATCSYDRKISIFSLITMSPKEKLKGHTAPIMKMMFLNKNRLISIDKDATAIIWNIHSGKIIERLQGIHDDVTQMTVSADYKFLFLGTKLGYILLYDLDRYELLSPKYIKIASSITSLNYDDEKSYLIIGTDDGFIMYYDIYEGQEKLNDMLKNKEFAQIQREASLNPILKYSQIYDLISNLWERTLEKARIALEHGDKEKAIILFKSFKDIPAKNSIMQKMIVDYEEFDKFKRFAKEGKLSLAYGLANSFPTYKESKIYQALEEKWKKVVLQAQKYIVDPKTSEKAQEVFKPYRGISEKTKLIQELLTQAEVYKRFRVAIAQKDFTICFELIKQHKFLKELPEYEVLMKYGDTLYIKSQEFLASGDTHSAVKMLRILSSFEDFKVEVKELMLEIEGKQKFYAAIENEDIAIAYDMLALVEELQETPDGKKLQEKWNLSQTKANTYAVNGDAKGVARELNEYMKISSKLSAIGTIFAWCYMVQLEDKARENAPQILIENGIKNYMLHFGLQDQIENFYIQFKEKYPKSKLTLDHLTQGSMSMWRPSMIVDSILE